MNVKKLNFAITRSWQIYNKMAFDRYVERKLIKKRFFTFVFMMYLFTALFMTIKPYRRLFY